MIILLMLETVGAHGEGRAHSSIGIGWWDAGIGDLSLLSECAVSALLVTPSYYTQHSAEPRETQSVRSSVLCSRFNN